jgi:MFS family permease
MAVMLPLGAAMVTFQVTSNSWLQVNAPPDIRGQVLSLYVMLFTGTTALGGPLPGWVAAWAGPRAAFVLGGFGALLAGAVAAALFAVSRRRSRD